MTEPGGRGDHHTEDTHCRTCLSTVRPHTRTWGMTDELSTFAQRWIEQAKWDGRLVQHIDGTWRLVAQDED